MSTLDFPTQDEINRIYGTTPFQPFHAMNERIFILLNKENESSTGSYTVFFKSLEATEILDQLRYKLMGAAKSYVLMSYFFEKGIPDDEAYISPGKRGESVEFFPHFEPIHFEVKDWFDYFSDTFYHKLFSALDMVGHLINLQYELGVKQKEVYFNSVVNKLRTKDLHLYQGLQEIRDDPIYLEANRLRNDIAHNYLPGSTGLSVTREKGDGCEGIKLGIRAYTPSSAIMSNAQKTVDLLERIVALVIE
jgi:hypothetical protein